MKEKRLYVLPFTLAVASVLVAFMGLIDVFQTLLIIAISVATMILLELFTRVNLLSAAQEACEVSIKKNEKKLIETKKILLRNQNKERRALYSSIESLIGVNELIKPRVPLPTMAGWAISSDSAKAIIEIFKNHKIKTVLDLGSGTSSVIFGYLLEGTKGASVISVDHDVNFSSITRNNLDIHGLSDVVSVYSKPLKKQKINGKTCVWYDLPEVENVDMVLVDGPPASTQRHARYPALPVVYDKLSNNAIVILDDYNREEEREVVNRWLKEYPDFTLEEIKTDKGLAVLYRNKQ